MISVDSCASPLGIVGAALRVACAQERAACAEAFGVLGGSSARVNVAPEEGCVGTFEEVCDQAADGLLGTSLSAQVEAGKGEGQNQGPVEGSMGQGGGLAVQWGVLGRTVGLH